MSPGVPGGTGLEQFDRRIMHIKQTNYCANFEKWPQSPSAMKYAHKDYAYKSYKSGRILIEIWQNATLFYFA